MEEYFTTFRCKVRTQIGKRCKRMTKDETHICHFHKSQFSECCICIDPISIKNNMECGHYVCRSCLLQLRDIRCPLCRREIQSHLINESEKEMMIQRFQYDRSQDVEMEENEIL